jgi:predicted nucleic acid-binding Zn ribbon protein
MNELLKEFMKRIPQKAELKRGMILHIWPQIVGSRIQSATKDLKFRGSTLIVTVASEAWRHEIHANRYSIAKKLNEKVDSDVVKEIVVRT